MHSVNGIETRLGTVRVKAFVINILWKGHSSLNPTPGLMRKKLASRKSGGLFHYARTILVFYANLRIYLH